MRDWYYIFISILLISALIWIEMIICKRSKKHKGLILPIVTAATTLSLILIFWQSSITVYAGDNRASAVVKFLNNPEDI